MTCRPTQKPAFSPSWNPVRTSKAREFLLRARKMSFLSSQAPWLKSSITNSRGNPSSQATSLLSSTDRKGSKPNLWPLCPLSLASLLSKPRNRWGWFSRNLQMLIWRSCSPAFKSTYLRMRGKSNRRPRSTCQHHQWVWMTESSAWPSSNRRRRSSGNRSSGKRRRSNHHLECGWSTAHPPRGPNLRQDLLPRKKKASEWASNSVARSPVPWRTCRRLWNMLSNRSMIDNYNLILV